MANPNTKVLTAHVPVPLAEKVDQLANRLERSRGWIIKQALSDLVRLYEFLAPVNKSAAACTVQALTAAPRRLSEQPRIGERLEEFEPREVRRLIVGHYEIRNEIQQSTIYGLGFGIREKTGDRPRPKTILSSPAAHFTIQTISQASAGLLQVVVSLQSHPE